MSETPRSKADDPVPAEDVRIVLSTAPPDVAHDLARGIVEAHLAACVNLVTGVRSVYRWEGAVHRDSEVLLIIKTTAERLANLTARIEALHPYEVPEVLAVPVAGGAERYLAWLGQTVS